MHIYYEIGSHLPQFQSSNLPHNSPDGTLLSLCLFKSTWCCPMLMGVQLPTEDPMAHSEGRETGGERGREEKKKKKK